MKCKPKESSNQFAGSVEYIEACGYWVILALESLALGSYFAVSWNSTAKTTTQHQWKLPT